MWRICGDYENLLTKRLKHEIIILSKGERENKQGILTQKWHRQKRPIRCEELVNLEKPIDKVSQT